MKAPRHDLRRGGEHPADPRLFSRKRAIDDALLDRTVELFQTRTGRTLSKEDARQIVENLSGFFRILAEWDKADRAAPSLPHAKPPAE